MTNDRLALFLDTNCFLQLKDFDQIVWSELFPEARHITLMVCSAVIGELDKHKVSTNQRRRNRARRALGQIESAAVTPEMTLTIRPERPSVDLAIWRGRPVWSDFPGLDERNPDDYLVVAAAGDADGIVLSHDTGPRIRARIAGVRAACPPDGWLLPIEQTDDQRKIGQLTRELEAAHNARPQVEVVMPPDEPLDVVVPAVPYLGSPAIRELVDQILAIFPAEHVSATRYSDRFAALRDPFYVGQTRIDAYFEEYEDFKSQLQEYFTTLHEKVAAHSLAQSAPGVIINVGSVSAKNLTLSVQTDGEVECIANREDAEKLLGPISLPKPPAPPRSRPIIDTGYSKLSATPRDPTWFYWRSRPKLTGSAQASLECADFRPGRERRIGVLVHAVGDLPSCGKLTIDVSAEHLEIVTAARMLRFVRSHAGWLDPLVQSLLPDPVREAFSRIDAAKLPTW